MDAYSLLQAFDSGRLSRKDIIKAMMDEASSCLREYAEIFRSQGREEAYRYIAVRNLIFDVRAAEEWDQRHVVILTGMIVEVESLTKTLLLHRPKEASLLGPTTSRLHNIRHVVKNYVESARNESA